MGINDRAEKRPAPRWEEKEGSNLIWLEKDVCMCVHGSAAQCEGTVGMGQEGYGVE